jgi:succinate dehydrogenase / fumarate reductase, membrane anchor subunit
MVKRIVVGAHYGLRDWLAQRITAVIMALYSIFIVVALLLQPTLDYVSWKALFANQWTRFATLIFLLSLFFHAWLGMRDIFMDYVHPVAVRLTLEIAVILALAFYTIWSIHILWGA